MEGVGVVIFEGGAADRTREELSSRTDAEVSESVTSEEEDEEAEEVTSTTEPPEYPQTRVMRGVKQSSEGWSGGRRWPIASAHGSGPHEGPHEREEGREEYGRAFALTRPKCRPEASFQQERPAQMGTSSGVEWRWTKAAQPSWGNHGGKDGRGDHGISSQEEEEEEEQDGWTPQSWTKNSPEGGGTGKGMCEEEYQMRCGDDAKERVRCSVNTYEEYQMKDCNLVKGIPRWTRRQPIRGTSRIASEDK